MSPQSDSGDFREAFAWQSGQEKGRIEFQGQLDKPYFPVVQSIHELKSLLLRQKTHFILLRTQKAKKGLTAFQALKKGDFLEINTYR